MIVVDSYIIAVGMCIVTMLCWGSWANTEKLASKEWKYQFFYWDYAIGVFLLALVLAFTMGSIGDAGRSFIQDLGQMSGKAFIFAFLGGVVFNLANILLVAAIDIAGLAVAFPVGIGLALVEGVIINYIANPKGNPVILFIGVFAVVVAMVFDAFAYNKLQSSKDSRPTKGIVLSVLAGLIMGLFYYFVQAGMASNFRNPEPGLLGPYAAVVVFSVGLLLSTFVWNSNFINGLMTGDKVNFKKYFTEGNSRLHLVGILGGLIWSLGMTFNIIASGPAGPSISYGLGQGATMVSALWGVFIWKEFEDAPKGTNILLTFMFLFFIVGLGMIIIARNI